MDPFSITVGALGITGFATSSIIQLRSAIDGLREAQDVLADVRSSLTNIERPLGALEHLSVSDESTSIAVKEDLEKAGVAKAVNRCGDACAAFHKDLAKWTKHSSTSKLSLRDRLSVGVWNRERIRTFRMRLDSCEATVQFAVASTQLMVQLRAETMSENDRDQVKKQMQTLEAKIQENLDLTKRQQDEAQHRRQELVEEPEDEEDGGAQRKLATQEVEDQSRLLEFHQAACKAVFSQVQSMRIGQDISNVVTLDKSTAVVGMPDSAVGKMGQRIKDIRTEGGSRGVVGVYNDVSLKMPEI